QPTKKPGPMARASLNCRLSRDSHVAYVATHHMAEDRGFEPLRAFTQPAFQASALGHYANPPWRRLPAGCGVRPIGTIRMMVGSPSCGDTSLNPPGQECSKGR